MDDCFDPTCHSKQDLFKMMLGRRKGKSNDEKILAAVKSLTSSDDEKDVSKRTPVVTSSEENDEGRIRTQAEVEGIECPADREELGRQSWTLLHTMAAYYPKKPSPSRKKMAEQFVTSLSHLYPCKHCAYYLRESIKKNPPQLESRDEFSTWMCEQHNEVNQRLGKATFDCSLANIYLRWRNGDRRCWLPAGYTPKEGDEDILTTARASLGHDDDDDDEIEA